MLYCLRGMGATDEKTYLWILIKHKITIMRTYLYTVYNKTHCDYYETTFLWILIKHRISIMRILTCGYKSSIGLLL